MAKTAMQTSQDDEIEVALDEASHSQLIWFSKHQGYEYDSAETQNQTYNRIKSAWDHPTIKVPSVIQENISVGSRIIDTTGPEDRYGLPEFVEVAVQGDTDDSDEIVKLAHNGRSFVLQAGANVILPWYVFKGCIDDAKMTKYSSGRDTGLGPVRITHTLSFTRIR